MYRKNLAEIDCSTARALDIVGEWWSLMIVRESMLGTTRFDAFQQRLGIARNVLTNRLNHLIEHGILKKVPIEGERFFEYLLTPKGEALLPVLVALMQWGDEWAGSGHGGPIRMVEDRSGEPVEWMAPRAPGGPVLGLRDIRFEPTPHTSPRTRDAIARRNRAILGSAADGADPAQTNMPPDASMR